MTWWMFYLIASGLLVLVVMLVGIPLIRQRSAKQRDSLTNTQIVRQRLAELEREVAEGLISEQDKRQASDELKLALADEHQETQAGKSSASLPLLAGALLAGMAGVAVYMQVNQLPMVERAQEARQALPRLSAQLANGGGDGFTQQDVTDLALAVRERLRHAPDDAQGWMLLGRLWMTMGQQQQAIQALEKSLAIAPSDSATQMTYIQALMGTGEIPRLRQAQQILTDLLSEQPGNDNLALLMAVASAQLGDLANTETYFNQVKAKLPEAGEMYKGLSARIDELRGQQEGSGQPSAPGELTEFSIEVSIADELRSKLPDSGYLIVFAQDALSENRMPAAVVKMPLQSLPARVSLSTQNAMLPSYTLDSLKEARLVARISTDENVAPQSGDLQGELNTPVISGASSAQAIVISKEL